MSRNGRASLITTAIVVVASTSCMWATTCQAFVATQHQQLQTNYRTTTTSVDPTQRRGSCSSPSFLAARKIGGFQGSQAAFNGFCMTSMRITSLRARYNDNYGNDDDDEEDDMIDVDSLGDWRVFRKNLASLESLEASTSTTASTDAEPALPKSPPPPVQKKQKQPTGVQSAKQQPAAISSNVKLANRRCRENEHVLRKQNADLAKEYQQGVWAHETATPEVGGLVVRMPLEVEIYRNYKHSRAGRRLRQKLREDDDDDDNDSMSFMIDADDKPNAVVSHADYYEIAQEMIQDEMIEIADLQSPNGEIDAAKLSSDRSELLQLYLDHQETWQEVNLVLEQTEKQSITLALNRPMSLTLTEHLAQLVLYGAGGGHSRSGTASRSKGEGKKLSLISSSSDLNMVKFLLAFGQECALYIGGPQNQHLPAEVIHGFAELPGAVEISPGTGIYRGGLAAAIDGVIRGKYQALDFRFFVGQHVFEGKHLEVAVILGKYQPIASARSLVLKQCLSLPKPLWHEVLELCGGEMQEICKLELEKREGIRFQVVEDDDDYYDENGEILDELDELETFDDDDDDDVYYI